MIDHIRIKNFKSLKDISVDTKNLNLLMGLNGMGKSSFIQMLLLLMQSDKLENRVIDLNGLLVEIGQGRDALYQFADEDTIEFGIKLESYPVFDWKFNYQKDKDKLNAENGFTKEAMEFFRSQTKKFQFISADRIGPKDLYEASSVVVSDKLTAQTNAWLNEISPGVSLNTKYVPEVNKVILDYQFDLIQGKTNSFKPKNVGFGLSYVLPIVVALLTAENGKIIVIENPESHIHPRGQAELGKLIALAAQTGAQLFIETHSDHVLNGIRVAVKEESVDKNKVNIMYFDKINTEKEQYSRINQINVDKNGSLSDYPKDMLDEWSNQLSKLF